MSFWHSIILGIVEGVTEFVPISSSGHLIIARQILGLQSADGLAVDAILQLGTIFAVLVYFWSDLCHLLKSFIRLCKREIVAEEDKRMIGAIVLGTIPAVIFGLLLQKYMETTFRSTHLVALTLLAGAALMYAADKFGRQTKSLTVARGFLVGLFQSLALVPGISRSGATISGGLLVGLNREQATRFSFLLAFPVIVGAGLKELWSMYKIGALASVGLSLGLGAVVAFITGLAAIHFLITFLKRHDLSIFIYYRIALALLVLIFL